MIPPRTPKKTSPQPPPPKPPDDDPLTAARALASAIHLGFPGQQVAALAFTAHGAEYIRTCAMQTPEEVIEGFRAEPDAWALFAPLEFKMKIFFTNFIAECRRIADELPKEQIQ